MSSRATLKLLLTSALGLTKENNVHTRVDHDSQSSWTDNLIYRIQRWRNATKMLSTGNWIQRTTIKRVESIINLNLNCFFDRRGDFLNICFFLLLRFLLMTRLKIAEMQKILIEKLGHTIDRSKQLVQDFGDFLVSHLQED